MKVIKILEDFMRSIWCAFGVAVLIFILSKFDYSVFKNITNLQSLDIFQIILVSISVIMLIWIIGGAVCIAFISIKSILAALYGCFFSNYDKKEIHIKVDENFIIRDSYLELSSGKIIPINIHKIIWGQDTKPSEELKGDEE